MRCAGERLREIPGSDGARGQFFVTYSNVHRVLDGGHRLSNVSVSTPLNLHRKIRVLTVLFLRGVMHFLIARIAN